MGMDLSSIFGGGYETPDAPAQAAVPRREEIREDESVRDAERRKLRARAGGVRSTLLAGSAASGNPGGLLGLSGAGTGTTAT